MAHPEHNQPNPWEIYPIDPSTPIAETDRVDAILKIIFGYSLEEVMNDPDLLNRLLIAWYGEERYRTINYS